MTKFEEIDEVVELVDEALEIINSTATPKIKLYLVESMDIGKFASERGMCIYIIRERHLTHDHAGDVAIIKTVLLQFKEDLGDLG